MMQSSGDRRIFLCDCKNSIMLFFLIIEKCRHNTVHLRLLNGRIYCEILNKLDKYLVVHEETVSAFFLELPVSFNGMFTIWDRSKKLICNLPRYEFHNISGHVSTQLDQKAIWLFFSFISVNFHIGLHVKAA